MVIHLSLSTGLIPSANDFLPALVHVRAHTYVLSIIGSDKLLLPSTLKPLKRAVHPFLFLFFNPLKFPLPAFIEHLLCETNEEIGRNRAVPAPEKLLASGRQAINQTTQHNKISATIEIGAKISTKGLSGQIGKTFLGGDTSSALKNEVSVAR